MTYPPICRSSVAANGTGAQTRVSMAPESLNDSKRASIESKGPALKEIPPPPPKGRRRTGWVWLVVTVLLVGGAYLFWYRGGSPHDTQAANKVSTDQKSSSG